MHLAQLNVSVNTTYLCKIPPKFIRNLNDFFLNNDFISKKLSKSCVCLTTWPAIRHSTQFSSRSWKNGNKK